MADFWDTPPSDADRVQAAPALSGDAFWSAPPSEADRIPPHVSRAESFARGVGQGMTLSFGDELAAGAGAALQKVFTKDPESFGQLYQRYRDEERADNKAAQAAHGGAYIGGELVGGLASGPAAAVALGGGAAPATLGTAITGGIDYGLVSGLGSSEADLTKGQTAQALQDVTKSGVIGGAAGLLGHGIVKGAGALIQKFRPSNTLVQKVAPEVDEAALKEGQALSQSTGVTLNAAQASKSPALLDLQEQLKDLPGGSKILEGKRLEAIEQLHNGLKDTLQSPLNGAEATKRVAAGYAAVEKQTNALIANKAKADFGLVDDLAGNRKFIPLQGTLNAVRELKDSMRSAVRTSENKAAIGQLNRIEKQLMGRAPKPSGLLDQYGAQIAPEAPAGPPLTTARKLQNALSGWGYAARSSDSVFKDVGRSESRRIAKAVFAALRDDLDAAANQAGKLGEAGQALVAARANYAKMMTARDAMKDELLDTAVKAMSKNHPETFTAKLLSRGQGVSDQMISRTMGTVQAMDAEAATAFRAASMSKLLEGAAPKASTKLAQAGAAIHPAKLVDMDQKLGSRITALYTGDPAGLAAYRKFIEIAKRLVLTGEKAPERAWGGLVERMPFYKSTAVGAGIGASIAGPPGAIAGAALTAQLARKVTEIGEGMTAKRLAWILTDRDAMQMLQRALNPKIGTTATQATQAATMLLYRLNQEATR